MSFFPTADPEKLRAAMAQQYAYYQIPATPSPPGQAQHNHEIDGEQRAHNGWPVTSAQDVYSTSQPMVWPSQHNHGLGLDMMTTPTQTLFDSQYPTPTTSSMPSVWNTASGMSLSSTSYPEYTIQQSAMEDCYPLASSLPTTTSWDAPHQDSNNFVPVYDSPGRSDYSTSSHQSLVESSPYAQSDDCYQLHSPPYIKIEDSSESQRPRLYSIPGSAPLGHPSHVNPGDLYTSPPPSAVDRAYRETSRLPSKVESEEDVKPFSIPSRSRRAMSEDSNVSIYDQKPKRGYTTHANSTCHCEKCGKLFQRSYNLKAHMDTHDPHRQQPHVCQYPSCKRRFVRRTDLIRHERSVSESILSLVSLTDQNLGASEGTTVQLSLMPQRICKEGYSSTVRIHSNPARSPPAPRIHR